MGAMAESDKDALARVHRVFFDLLVSSAPGEVPSDLNWDLLLQLTRRHGLPGLMKKRVSTQAPTRVFESLEHAERLAVAKGLRLQREALDSLLCMNQGGVEHIAPLKGTALLPMLYGNYGARTTNDIDLLIRFSDRDVVHTLLMDNGYEYIPKPSGRPVSQERGYERTYLSPGGVLLDIHTGFCQQQRVGLCYESLWERMGPDNTGVFPNTHALSAEDTALFLAIHLAQDCFQGPFRQWIDLAWWLQTQSVNMGLLVQRAREAGAGTLLWSALSRLSFLQPESISGPREWEALRPRGPRALYLKRLIERPGLTPLPYDLSSRLAQSLTLFQLMDGVRRRFSFFSEYAALRIQDPVSRWWDRDERSL